MARATSTTRIVKVVNETEIVLTLSEAEAEALMIVLGAVGGESNHSKRKYTESVYNALRSVGVKYDLWSNEYVYEKNYFKYDSSI